MALCCLVCGYRRLGGIYRLHFQGSGELSWKVALCIRMGRKKRATENRLDVGYLSKKANKMALLIRGDYNLRIPRQVASPKKVHKIRFYVHKTVKIHTVIFSVITL
jgi:hypothetical protein